MCLGLTGDDPYADYAGRGGQGQMMKGPGQKGGAGAGGEDQSGKHKTGMTSFYVCEFGSLY